MSSKSSRIDELLVQRGEFGSIDEAARACFAGEVSSPDVKVTAPSQRVPKGTILNVRRRSRFVSRGGDKLQGALDDFGFDPAGMRCIDVGASSGGFTDCLLQAGAAHVAAVDVAHSQLAWSLRNDSRVSAFDGTNIRDADAGELGGPFDLLVADVSFISLSELFGTFRGLLLDSGFSIVMVKPQFEIDRDSVESGGVVRSPEDHARVLEDVLEALRESGFEPLALVPSRVPGKKKRNLEFFFLSGIAGCADSRPSCLRNPNATMGIDVEQAVAEAHGSAVGQGGETADAASGCPAACNLQGGPEASGRGRPRGASDPGGDIED